MSRVVHYYGGFRELHSWNLNKTHTSLCGVFYHPDKRFADDRCTTNKNSVTRKLCLRKLGVKPAPVVDEQKVRFAEAIERSCIQISVSGYCVFCCSSDIGSDGYLIHEDDCITKEATEYLSSIKEAE